MCVRSTDCAADAWVAQSIECAIRCAFYRMAPILGIPRLRSAFYRMRKSTDWAEHIHMYMYIYIHVYVYSIFNLQSTMYMFV